MLDIAFELIGEGTLNSLLMFCFCNLIIVMIFTGSSKPASMDSQDSTFVTPVSYNMCYIASDDHYCGDHHDDDVMNVAAAVPSAQDELIDDSSSDEEEDRESSHCYADDDDDGDDDDDDDDDESKEAEVEDEEGDDDLRKRVEDFIAKINSEWRHEKLRALNLVY